MLRLIGLIFRILAWAFVAGGVGLLFYALLPMFQESQPFRPQPLAQIWSEFHSSSQLGVAHTLERWLGSDTYHGIVVPYFWNIPAFVVLLIIGLILWLLTARRRDRKDLEPKNRKW